MAKAWLWSASRLRNFCFNTSSALACCRLASTRQPWHFWVMLRSSSACVAFRSSRGCLPCASTLRWCASSSIFLCRRARVAISTA